MTYSWTCGSGYVNLVFESLEQAQFCSHPGPCDADVKALSQEPGMARQLAEIGYSDLRKTLREFGAWDAKELADHDQNLQRLLWIAACDVAERPEDFLNR